MGSEERDSHKRSCAIRNAFLAPYGEPYPPIKCTCGGDRMWTESVERQAFDDWWEQEEVPRLHPDNPAFLRQVAADCEKAGRYARAAGLRDIADAIAALFPPNDSEAAPNG